MKVDNSAPLIDQAQSAANVSSLNRVNGSTLPPSTEDRDITMKSNLTQYHQIQHPNQMNGEAADGKAKNGCIAKIEEWDRKYLWPIFIYKHKRLLKRLAQGQTYEVEDMLQEYKQIEDEIYETSSGSDSDEKHDRFDMSFNNQTFTKFNAPGDIRRTAAEGHNGLLSQYCQMKSGGSQYSKAKGSSNKTLKFSKIAANNVSIKQSSKNNKTIKLKGNTISGQFGELGEIDEDQEEDAGPDL